jgi:hypothetical protein
MTPAERALAAYQDWYSELPLHSGMPARGTIAAALMVLERLQESFDLPLDSHLTSGRAQIIGVSKANVQRILARFGENRTFLKEGGRTNRGVPGMIESMLSALEKADLASLPVEERNSVLQELQRFLVAKVGEYHGRKRIEAAFDSSQSTRQFIFKILDAASKVGKRGPVAQHLVGAKLKLRFPHIDVRNESTSAPDDQSGQPGDFHLGDMVFHVTVAPSSGHYEQCKQNLRDGRRVTLLVPDDKMIGARQIADQEAPGQVAVESIESFVGQNIEELSTFQSGEVAGGLRRLLETYNERVATVETDLSLMIEIPVNLGQSENGEDDDA